MVFQDKVVLPKYVMETEVTISVWCFSGQGGLADVCVMEHRSDHKCVVFQDKVVLWKYVMETEVTISVGVFQTRWSCRCMCHRKQK